MSIGRIAGGAEEEEGLEEEDMIKKTMFCQLKYLFVFQILAPISSLQVKDH